MAARLCVHPAFYRRVRHYRDRIGVRDGRPEVAVKFVRAAAELVLQLLQNPQRGHPAGFESVDLADGLQSANNSAIPTFISGSNASVRASRLARMQCKDRP